MKPIFKFALSEGLSDEFLPTRASERATGWDVKAAEEIYLRAGGRAKISLGFRAFIPEGWWLELRPRSSSFAKKSLHALYGVIDEDYEGQLIFACQYIPSGDDASNILSIKKGEAIGQIVPVRRNDMLVEKVSNEEFDALCKKRNAARGSGGFGSTG